MARAVIGLFNTQSEAEQAVRDLKAAGFAERDLGMVTPEQPGTLLRETPSSRSTEGAVAGGFIGGTLGAVLAATGALVVPGVGPFITGGILVTLVGGAAGWLVGGLAGLGVSAQEADYYEQQVQSGRTLVAVNTSVGEEEAMAIMSRYGGEISRQGDGHTSDSHEPDLAGTLPASETRPAPTASSPRAAPSAMSAAPTRPDTTLTGPGLRATPLPTPDGKGTAYDRPDKGPLMPGSDP